MFSSPSAVNCSASKSSRSRRGILKETDSNNTAPEDECEQSMSASTMKIEVSALTPRASPRQHSVSNMYLGSNSAPVNRGVSSLLSVDSSPPRGQRRSIFKGPVSNSSLRTSSNPIVSPRKVESPPLSYAPEPPPLVDTPQQRLLHNLCRLPGCETKLKSEMLSDEVVETDGTYFNPGYESWMAKKASAALAEVSTYSSVTSRRESQNTITVPVQSTGSFANSKGLLTKSYYNSTSRPALQSTPFLPSIPTGSRMLKKSVTSFEQLRASPRPANLSPQQRLDQESSSQYLLYFEGSSISDPFGGGNGGPIHNDAFEEIISNNNNNISRKPFLSITEDTDAVEGGSSRRSVIKRSNRPSEITNNSSTNASTRKSEPFSPFTHQKPDSSLLDMAGKNRVAHFSEQLVTEAKQQHPGGGIGGGPALFGGATLHATQPDKYSSSTQAMSSLLKRSKSSVVSYQSPVGSRRTSSSSMHDNYIMAAAAARRKAAEQHTKDLISQFRRLRTKMATFIQLISAVHNNSQESMRSIMGAGNRSAHPRVSYTAVALPKSEDSSLHSFGTNGGGVGELNVNVSCDISGSAIGTPFIRGTPSPLSSTTFPPPSGAVGGGVVVSDSPRTIGFDLAPTSSSQYRAATKQKVLTMLHAYWDMMSTYATIGSDEPAAAAVPSSPIITAQQPGDQPFPPKPIPPSLHLPPSTLSAASPPRGPRAKAQAPVTPTPPPKRQEDPTLLPPAHPFQEGGNLHRFLRRDPHMLVLSDWHCNGPSSSFTHSSGPKARSTAILHAEMTDEYDTQAAGSSPSPSRPVHHHHQSPSSSHTGQSPLIKTLESNTRSVDLLSTTSPRLPTDFQIAESRLLDEALYHKKTPQLDTTLEGAGHFTDEDKNTSTPQGGEYTISLRFPDLMGGEASPSLPKLNDEVESAAFAFDLSCALRKAWRIQKVHTENLLLDSGLPPDYTDDLNKSGMSDSGGNMGGDSPETPTTKKKSSKPQAPIQGVASTEEWIDDSLEFLKMIDDHIASLEKHQQSQNQPSSPHGGAAMQGLRQNSFCEKPLPSIEDTGDFHLFPCSVLMYLLCYEGLAKVPPPPLEGVLIYQGYTRPLTISEETLREQFMWKQIEAIAQGKGGPLQPLRMQEAYPTLRGAGTAIGMSDLTQHWVILSGLTASLPGGASKKKLRQLSVICKRNRSRTAGSVSVFGGATGVTVPKMSPGLKDLSLPFCNIGIEGLLVLMEYLATGGRGLGPNGEVESSSDDEYAGSEDLVVTRSFVPETELQRRAASHGRRVISRTTVTGPPISQKQKNSESWGHFMQSSAKITTRITLSSLDLSYNRIDCHCLVVLKAFLPHTFITSISLRHNDLGEVGFEEHIAFLLGDDAGLESLDLSFTSLSMSSKASVIRTIPRSQLISLKLEGLQFSASEAIALFHSASNNKSLLELSLVFNGSCGSKGYVQRVQDVLKRNTKSLEERFARAAAELVHHLTKKNEMSASVIGNGGITTVNSSSPGGHNRGGAAAKVGGTSSPQRVSSFVTRGEGALSAGYGEYTTNDPTHPCWLSPPN